VYRDQIEITYKMGGLAKEAPWVHFPEIRDQFTEQLALHLQDVAERSGMPIDASFLLEDPPDSTWPANIAFKAAEHLDKTRAPSYLRRLREAGLTEKKNLGEEEVLRSLAEEMGYDGERFLQVYLDGTAEEEFMQDLSEGRSQEITGFPTLVIESDAGKKIQVVGLRPFEVYQNAIEDMSDTPLIRYPPPSIMEVVFQFERITLQEISEIAQKPPDQTLEELQELEDANKVSLRMLGSGLFVEARQRIEDEVPEVTIRGRS